MGGFITRRPGSIRLLRAEFPSGARDPSAYAVPLKETARRDLSALLYGRASGLGTSGGTASLEVGTAMGRYLVIRDLATDEVVMETLAGRPAPDPSLISPGAFLLGAGPPTTHARTPTPPDLGPALRSRAAHLRREARALAEGADPITVPTPVIEESALHGALDRLFQREGVRIETDLARNARIEDLLRDLRERRSGGVPAKWRPALEAAQRRDALVEESWGSPAASLLVATAALASVSVAVGGHLLGEVLWTSCGLVLSGVSMLGAAWLHVTRRRRAAHGVALQENLEQALRRSLEDLGVTLPKNQVPTAADVRCLIAESVVAVGSERVRRPLLELTLRDADRARLERRLVMARKGVPEELRDELAGLWEQEPLFALPGLVGGLRKGFLATRQASEALARRRGVREALTAALEREAAHLEREARRHDRATRLAAIWDEAVAGEPRPAPWLWCMLLEELAVFAQVTSPRRRATTPSTPAVRRRVRSRASRRRGTSSHARTSASAESRLPNPSRHLPNTAEV
jgi:hypothetical protein